MAEPYSTPSLPRPVYQYFKPPLRQQGGIGLARLPTEVKRMIARECYAQDRALLKAADDIAESEHGKGRRILDDLERLRASAKSIATLYSLSREWRTVATPFRFTYLDRDRLDQLDSPESPISRDMLRQYGLHFRQINMSEFDENDYARFDKVFDLLPHLDQLEVDWFPGMYDLLPGPYRPAAETLARLFARAVAITGMNAYSLTEAVVALESASRLQELDLSFQVEPEDQLQDLWRMLQSLPELRKLALSIGEHWAGQSETFTTLLPADPAASLHLPAISHLRITTPAYGKQLAGFSDFVGIFASTLRELEVEVLEPAEPEDDWEDENGRHLHLGDVSRFRILRKISLTDSWFDVHHFCESQLPAALEHLVVRIGSNSLSEYQQISGIWPAQDLRGQTELLDHPNVKVVELYSGDGLEIRYPSRSQTYPGGAVVQLHPRLYPSLALQGGGTDALYELSRHDEDELGAPSDYSKPSDHLGLFECEGIVKSIDETMAFLSEWRDRAIRTSDTTSLLALANRLKDADWDRVIHLA